MKEKISKLLWHQLGGVYCDSCEYGLSDERCEGCHRKYMNWAISKEAADGLADAIMEVVNGEKKMDS